MDHEFQLFPEQASSYAAKLDWLYYSLVGVAVFFTILICVLILTFAIRYRRGSRASRESPSNGNLKLEFTWALIPFVIMMISFGWGTRLFMEINRPPADAIDMYVVAKQWMWKCQNQNGKGEINELHVPVETPVRVTLISEDVIHSFFVPAFRVKQDVLPGRYTSIWFRPTKPGTYHLFCAEYCGTSHAAMRGKIVVMERHEYAAWLERKGTTPASVEGRLLFERFKCGDCHGGEASDEGPMLGGLFHRTETMRDGERIEPDLSYVRQSILEPQARVVAGYQPVMPAFQLSEEQVFQLAAYLETLSAQPLRSNTLSEEIAR